MKFKLQNYNEFKHVRWHDYVSVLVNEFPILLVRKYDWPGEGDESYVYLAQVLGFTVYHKVGEYR